MLGSTQHGDRNVSTGYFSERETGPRPRVEQDISLTVWGGLYAIILALIKNGAFGVDFPDQCSDGEDVIGTSWHTMALTLHADIPDLPWPAKEDTLPATRPLMDFIEFCHSHVAKPLKETYHPFFRHHHLSFDREAGQAEFRESVNRIFSRNGLAYDLQKNGKIKRLAPPILNEALATAVFNTGDSKLDAMLESARQKYLSPDPTIRRESLEKLWDAWERVKTIEHGPNKKTQTRLLLEKAASEPKFREVLENEAVKLTEIGNTFHIRHSETSQVPLEKDEHVDYLFHRLFSIIQLLLRTRTA